MADRVLSVRLQMEVDGARRANKALARDMVGLAQSAEAGGRAADRAMGTLAAGAVAAGRAVGAVGGLAAGGMAAVTASVVKGGIAYNTLEQTSRAALTTLTGSASAANAQMDQLREFGKTSPFPRQVWIQAQQTLLAFGMEAERIIPTFQAIQDAVAAAGGSGQTISEIVQILARIQSTGKVTAEELNELGYRGIDAAKLVGEAMGKTAGEVRADITAQAISGQQFLDVLTSAMSQHFAGAAAGVKETWAGAVDRVKGAIRDIGSVLATPLVNPTGGGAAVDWANAAADALRALEARLIPVMDALGDRAGPVLDKVTEKLQALAEWIRNADFAELGQKMQAVLPAIAGITAGFTVMGAQSLPVLDKMLGGLKPLPIAIAAAALASPELRSALFELLSAAQPLLVATGELAKVAAGALGPAFSLVAALLQPVIAVVEVLGNILEALPGPIQMVIAGFVAWKALGVGSWLMANVGALRTFNDQMKVHQALAAMSGQQVGTMGAAYSVAASRVSDAGKKVASAASGIRGALTGAIGFLGGPWGAAIGLGITALTAFSMAQEGASNAASEFTYQIDAQTGALTRSNIAELYKHIAEEAKFLGENGARVSEVLDGLGLTIDDAIGYLMGEEEAIKRVNKALERNDYFSRGLKQWLDAQSASIARQTEQQNKAAGAADRYANSTEGAANASQYGAAAAAGFANGLYGVGDAADSVATRTQQLQSVLSGLFDAQFALAKAQDDFQGGLHALQAAFATNEKASQKSTASNDKYADSLKRQAKIVRDTQKQLRDLAEAQREAEKEAAEAARNARQRALDELFGRQFDVQSTLDAFRGGLAQAGTDIAQAREDKTAGAASLSGFSAGALANRDRMRSLVQQAQAAIQAERDRGASPDRLRQVSSQLAAQLGQQAAAWGLNASEVKQYTDAIRAFGNLASQKIVVDLGKVRKEFAEQRAEIHENSREQIENAKESAASAQQQVASAGATKRHTAALTGNSESAIKNREMMRQLVKQAQDELTQMHLNGASKEQLTRRGEELAAQLEDEAVQLGFNRRDVRLYTDTIHASAQEIARYPTLNARANVAGAMTTVKNFVAGVNKQLAKIQKNFSINVRTGSEYINSSAGGRIYAADGGYIAGPGGPREDKIPAMLSNGEFVVNARDTAKNRMLLEVINQGGEVSRPGFARGGYVDPINLRFKPLPPTGLQQLYNGIMQALMPGGVPIGGGGPALQWAASQAGKPYIWGGVGPRGYDCSGFMSAITNVIQGRYPHARRFATGSFPTGDFARGPGRFMIGSFRGNPGHMAGTLGGVNVESRGGEGVVVGRRARGAQDGLFGGNIWHLKGYADGGLVTGAKAAGDPPFDLISPRGLHFEEVLGSYAKGTDYVPMDGLYELHKGESVTPAGQNRPVDVKITVAGDGSRAADYFVDQFNKAQATGRITVTAR
jgi:tape measure domain-containing protein